jgi:hypothetical protein
MGFFSWNCKSCGRSIRSGYSAAGYRDWMQQAVAILPDGSVCKGTYDGYGNIGHEEDETLDSAALYHEACWEHAGEPTVFNGPSDHAGDQGIFVAEPFTVFPPDYDPAETGADPQHVYEHEMLLVLREAAVLGVLEKVGLSADTTFAGALEAMEERAKQRDEEFRREQEEWRAKHEEEQHEKTLTTLQEAGFDLENIEAKIPEEGMTLANEPAIALRDYIRSLPEEERPVVSIEFQGAPDYEAIVSRRT